MIPIAKPLIGQEEIDGVVNVMRSGVIAEGPKVKEFEEAFARYIGVEHAIAVNSGTAALLVALQAKGLGPGDEVITTPFTFIATANAILYTGARPVFADIREDTFNIDPEDVKSKITDRTKAIIPVDLYGQTADMKAIMDIASDHCLAVIEDACQAHGASIDGKKAGSFDVGCFSFYPTKNMTTSEGGMVTSADSSFSDRARMVRSHGSRIRYFHEMLGFNLRMTDISAAIGLAQLRKIDAYNDKRVENATRYSEKLAGIRGLVTPTVGRGNKHVFHQYTIRITDAFGIDRDEVIRRLGSAGIGSGIYYPLPIHLQQYYKQLGFNDSHPIAERMAKEVISLPVHPSVTFEDINLITDTIRGLSH
ncbi:putative aminotransferase [Methanocella paludicola SANAE]|uniref:Aminotransferase n=1 Tax=Methanocella paludicola (strain DSM 17711 / JCM 13418 / NBRC 101707 / SANAE) TaxID=304371 RepID=D1YWL4_METPS|nr:DegT/DnrJ/EryC1/StrS family aminotransferase [Methanocella paludicola]BAI60836.1 putative aminotransferase [Methanocella paludicola SANAE]